MKAILINVAVIAILLLIVAGIVLYLIRAKRRGETCIGCPYAKQCGGKCGGGCPSSGGDNK